jgi:type II secretory ATPase GspE/PulE/Tfp pilus assembly ATPase PilB-like protein
MATLRQGGLCLRERFGDEVTGEREETRRLMLDWLVQDLRITDHHADQLLLQLESSGTVSWREDSPQDGLDEATSTGRWTMASAAAGGAEDSIRFLPDPDVTPDEMSPALSLLRRGVAARATDVHIDPDGAGNYVVRFRIDGRIEPFCTMQHDVAGTLIKQLKLLADISLADPFQPSESRLKLPPAMARFEVRITTVPVPEGQAIALRVIDRDKLHRPLNELGLSPASFAAAYRMLHRGSGLVLITGPTGSGKTTTAYSMLKILVSEQQTIMSIEDPVELLVPFIRQLNVDERHGLTMKVGLSTLLRMDPDVVFVGEVRNMEAAETAVQAACCGKRVFSTMHMRDVSATVSAMRELNIDSRSLADNLAGILTQRLVRRLCRNCNERISLTEHERDLFASEGIEAPADVRRPRGCSECRNTGYSDRVGIFEAVAIDGDIAEGIREGRSEKDVRQIIRAAGTPSLRADGLRKVGEGITSVEEVQAMTWVPDASDSPPPDELRTSGYERGVPYKGGV